MNFKSLTVDGFKSFGEKTFIEFEEGLTGLVGPNGCGKSNVVEALKFVMGESSARQLRGTELNQLIFSGNSNKSEKKYAELKLVIETDDQEIMKKFNSSGEIEIIRRIERNKGSFFYINQKPYRSKDVQPAVTPNNATAPVSECRTWECPTRAMPLRIGVDAP